MKRAERFSAGLPIKSKKRTRLLLSSRPEPAERFLNVRQLNGVTSRVNALPHICESGPARRFRHGRLLLNCGYGVEAAGAIENRSVQKTARRMEAPVPFRDAFAT